MTGTATGVKEKRCSNCVSVQRNSTRSSRAASPIRTYDRCPVTCDSPPSDARRSRRWCFSNCSAVLCLNSVVVRAPSLLLLLLLTSRHARHDASGRQETAASMAGVAVERKGQEDEKGRRMATAPAHAAAAAVAGFSPTHTHRHRHRRKQRTCKHGRIDSELLQLHSRHLPLPFAAPLLVHQLTSTGARRQ